MIPLEYLQTKSTLWYVTGKLAFNGIKVHIIFEPLPLVDYTGDVFPTFFGTEEGGNANRLQIRGRSKTLPQDGLLEYTTQNGCSVTTHFSANTVYDIWMDKSGMTINNVRTDYPTPCTTVMGCNLPINGSGVRAETAKYYFVGFYNENGSVIEEYQPALDEDNNVCFYQTKAKQYLYHTGTGNPTGGTPLHIFTTNPSSLKFESTGGTLSFTVSAETGWTCTTPTAFTISTTAGTSGDTVVTVTAPNYTGSTRIDEDITLTDDDGYTASVHLRQKPVSTGVQSNIYLGNTNIEVLKLGDKAVETIYLGDVQVYAQGAFQGLKMTKTASLNKDSGSTTTIKVKASEAWTLSIDTAVTWLSASVSTGDTGETVVTLSALEDNTASTRSTVISATSANFSATCVVTQYYAHYVGFIYAQPMGNHSSLYIDTGIIPTKDTVFRFKCMGAGYETGNITVGNYNNDSKDYRLFFYSPTGGTLMFDYNSERIQSNSWGGVPNGREVDITVGNYYVYDNIKGENICTGATQSQDPMEGLPIKVCVGQVYVKSLEIWEGQTKVFDGKAAIDDATGHIGLFDDVTGQLVYNPDLTMGYGEVQKVNYICTNPLSGRTNQYIETGIYPTTATTMRIKFQGKGIGAYGKILGFSFSSEEPVWKSASDSTDYRFSNYDIDYRIIFFDYNNQRIELRNQPYFDDGNESDLTFGNYYIYDNDLGVNIVTGTTQTTQATTTIPIMVNVSTIWLKSLEIWQGNTKVFDGSAATMGNIIGLYDSVSDKMVWNPDLTMQAITN